MSCAALTSLFSHFSSREELKDYWQKVISIDKVTEFHKHHCSEELKHFLAVEQNTSGVRTCNSPSLCANDRFRTLQRQQIW